ncbi:cation:proton antiporter [Phytoactinopolyspora mesophila]|uniref:Cation/H(+) antiporter n=1 Tax=Phytoactinopolyspora mesophila TaxID=2650750 RepID=A0A7K3M0R7_9ACTN|nr:cation:proton antiporter [Phytoactinopolyspora mesophila]NDL56869.1 cation/H(+) antiporter [Phytoactinopolyspora mesophila]
MAVHGVPVEVVVTANIAIVLIVGVVMVQVFRRIYQPPVIAEIAAGLMLGPSLLGLLPGDIPEVIFPLEARPMLSAVAEVGLLLFMFLIGWELDLTKLRRRKRALFPIAGLSMAVPFALGAAAAALLLTKYKGANASTGVFVFYLATAFSITAFPVLARIIRDSRISKTTVGVTAIACAAIGDVVAWCVLVLLLAVVDANDVGQFFVTVGLTVAFGLVVGCVVRPLLRAVLRRADRPAMAGTLSALVASGVFLSAYATSWIGVHAIFGAFAVGLAMPRDGGRGLEQAVGVPLEKVAALLLPVFFIVTGLSVDISALGWSGLLALTLVIGLAIVGKFAGAAVPARLSGMNWRDSAALGTLMNTRGLTEIVVLNIGLQRGIIDSEMFTMMIAMALMTTAMAGPLLRWLRVTPPVMPDPMVPPTPVLTRHHSGRRHPPRADLNVRKEPTHEVRPVVRD